MNATRHPNVNRAALLSDCGVYRYTLDRVWAPGGRYATFVMLNPSIADASIDDPTIRRCVGFAMREGYGALRVVNLFAFRSPTPEKMKAAADPIGPRNDEFLTAQMRLAARQQAIVVAAWGVHGAFQDRATAFAGLAAGNGVRLHCLGVTKDGTPRHPLYVPKEAALLPWPPAEIVVAA